MTVRGNTVHIYMYNITFCKQLCSEVVQEKHTLLYPQTSLHDLFKGIQWWNFPKGQSPIHVHMIMAINLSTNAKYVATRISYWKEDVCVCVCVWGASRCWFGPYNAKSQVYSPSPPSSMILAVPKSVIWMCIHSSSKMFSGFKSLQARGTMYIQTPDHTSLLLRPPPQPNQYSWWKHCLDSPVNNSFTVEVFQRNDNLSRVELCCIFIKRTHLCKHEMAACM